METKRQRLDREIRERDARQAAEKIRMENEIIFAKQNLDGSYEADGQVFASGDALSAYALGKNRFIAWM